MVYITFLGVLYFHLKSCMNPHEPKWCVSVPSRGFECERQWGFPLTLLPCLLPNLLPLSGQWAAALCWMH